MSKAAAGPLALLGLVALGAGCRKEPPLSATRYPKAKLAYRVGNCVYMDLNHAGRPVTVQQYTAADAPYAAQLGQGFLGVGVGPQHQGPDGKEVRTGYLLPFEIVSVHLLVVLIGAAYLARAKRRRRLVND